MQNLRGFSAWNPLEADSRSHRIPGGSRQKNLSDFVLEGLLYFISPPFINMKYICNSYLVFFCVSPGVPYHSTGADHVVGGLGGSPSLSEILHQPL